jgi:hypothetical protein
MLDPSLIFTGGRHYHMLFVLILQDFTTHNKQKPVLIHRTKYNYIGSDWPQERVPIIVVSKGAFHLMA